MTQRVAAAPTINPDMSVRSPRTPVPKRGSARDRMGRWDVKIAPYLYIAPFFILFFVVGLFPILFTAVISFMDWDLVRGTGTFIGFDQYSYVLAQPKFWIALRNTFSMFLLSSGPQMVVAIFLAAILSQNLRAKTFWRMGVLLPYIIAPVAVALIFSNMFGDKYGLINTTLAHIGIPAIPWHSNAFASHLAIATMVNFRWTGYNTLILLAAMQAIPRDYYEAAAVDGAGKVRQFFSITLPGLRPTLIFVIVTSTIGGLQIFDEPRMYDQFGTGGANSQWLTITLYLYNIGWGQWNFGRAAALAWILFIIILLIGVINLMITRSLVRNDKMPTETTGTRRRGRRRSAENHAGGIGTTNGTPAATGTGPAVATDAQPNEVRK